MCVCGVGVCVCVCGCGCVCVCVGGVCVGVWMCVCVWVCVWGGSNGQVTMVAFADENVKNNHQTIISPPKHITSPRQ